MDSSQQAVRSSQPDIFKRFTVWQKAHQLTIAVYRASRSFPREELYGYTSQIRRAVLSTPTNIVEGSKRRSHMDFRHFLNIAQSSNEEVKYLLLVGQELGYVTMESATELIAMADEVGAMLHAFVSKMRPTP